MHVIKRDGRREPVAFDKITARLRVLALDLPHVDVIKVTQRVVAGVFDNVHTSQLDELAAETAVSMTVTHPQYSVLAARIAITNLHKETIPSFSTTVTTILAPILQDTFVTFVQEHSSALDAMVNHDRDLHAFDYFGFKTLERAYLLRNPLGRKVVERPQFMLLRVAIAVEIAEAGPDILTRIANTYNLMSQGYYTHATPTLFNSGLKTQQLSSCFLLQMQSDSIEGIFNTLSQCAKISKFAGGIGLAVHNIRSNGSTIHSTQGRSSGLVPMLRVFNETARYVDQGGGKRKGAFSIYIEPWHADIFEVLQLRKNQGNEHERARDLFYALWTPDLFMKRVEEDGTWTLFDPNSAPGLHLVHSAEFVELYERYEREGRGVRTVRAQELFHAICTSQEETGTPYMLFKDACNAKSNQQHLGTIQCSNLCTEVVQYTSEHEIAVCNLASLALPAFVVDTLTPDTKWRSVGGGLFELVLSRAQADLVNWRSCPIPVTVECVADEALPPIPWEYRGVANPSSVCAHSMSEVQSVLVSLGLHVHDSVADTTPPRFVRISLTFHGCSVDDDTEVLVELRRLSGDAFVFGRVFRVLQHVLGGVIDVEEGRSQLAGDSVILVDGRRDEEVGDEDDCSDLASIYYIDGSAVIISTTPFKLPLTRLLFDYDKLYEVTKRVAANLDKVIDANFYPLEEAERSNKRHRPVGIGVQGFADVLARLMVPFDSEEASRINVAIFETMYHAAVTASTERAVTHGVYPTFEGSPASRGLLQYHLWGKTPSSNGTLARSTRANESVYLDWETLESNVREHGLRNSLLIAPMPTASTAQILGNNESFEPFTSNMYTRRVLAGEFPVVNKHLVNTLMSRGLWTPNMSEQLVAAKGSVQPIADIPEDIRAVFKTVWEIKHRVVMDMSIARAPFVCQSQSLNAHIEVVTEGKLRAMHLYAWRNGLKTGMYYLRSRPKADPIAFTVDPALQNKMKAREQQPQPQPQPQPPACETCSA